MATRQKAAEILTLDLKEALPDIFMLNTNLIPRLVDRVWRKACDDALAENEGIYAHKGGTIVHIYFYELPFHTGKAKVSGIRDKIAPLLQQAKKDDSILEYRVEKGSPSGQQKGPPPVNPDVAKFLKEGLGINPTAEVFRLWTSRVKKEMEVGAQTSPLTRDMRDVAAKADVSYAPWWRPANEMLIGSIGCVWGQVPALECTPVEIFRQDLAVLFAACLELEKMQAKVHMALIVVPVRMATLANNEALDLYLNLLRRLNPEIRKNLIIEVKNLPKDTVLTHLVIATNSLSELVRAFVFETGMLSYADYGRSFAKLHACGFDLSESRLDENEQTRLLKKYAAYYSNLGLKTYIKGVTNPRILDAAMQAGFAYISGILIKPQQKSYFPLQKLPLEDIKRG